MRALETTGASISLRAKHVERVAFVVAILLLPYATNPSQMQVCLSVRLNAWKCTSVTYACLLRVRA